MLKTHSGLSLLPDSPGVYFFLSPQDKILYIGKATSLKQRVKSYFSKNIIEARSALIDTMVMEADHVDFVVTDSVLEALILETNLIRSHKPHYNTKSKDDKSYNHLVITNEEWPRVLVVRGKDITERFLPKDIKCHFGPFPNGSLLREALKIVRKIFRYYDTKNPIGTEKSKVVRGRIDFNRQIGLYPDQISKVDYQKTIRHIKLFFEGKKTAVIKELEKDMAELAKRELFEEANQVKKKIFALKHIEDIALIKHDHADIHSDKLTRIEAYDVAHHGGKDMVGVMTVIVAGETAKHEYRKFKIKTVTGANDPAALREILERRIQHSEWRFPDIVVVDGNDVQKKVAQATFSTISPQTKVVAVVKNEQHKPESILGDQVTINKYKLEILHANAEAHRYAITYHREKGRKRALHKS
jgi:excinuclease ABC subunit C